MRKRRITTWIIALAICVIIVGIQKRNESYIPYEQRNEIKVYCLEQFKPSLKTIIEKSSLGEDHRVVFTENKAEAEVILTDTITASDVEYEKLGWTPLIVAFDDTSEGKVKSYEESGYLTQDKSNSSYNIDFKKVILETLKGKFEYKIYCPKSDTKEGQLFFDFLLVNINNGKYPKNEEEMEKCSQIANQFLSSNNVIEMNTTERLEKVMKVVDEIYIIFENNIYNMQSDAYDFEISYPTNTVVYEYYYCLQGKNEMELIEIVNQEKFSEFGNRLQNLMYDNRVRYSGYKGAYSTQYYHQSNGFSYVEIPLKEE